MCGQTVVVVVLLNKIYRFSCRRIGRVWHALRSDNRRNNQCPIMLAVSDRRRLPVEKTAGPLRSPDVEQKVPRRWFHNNSVLRDCDNIILLFDGADDEMSLLSIRITIFIGRKWSNITISTGQAAFWIPGPHAAARCGARASVAASDERRSRPSKFPHKESTVYQELMAG